MCSQLKSHQKCEGSFFNELTKDETIGNVPLNVMERILHFCEIKEMPAVKATCKSLRDLANGVLENRVYLRNCAKTGFDEKMRGQYWLVISKCSLVTDRESEHIRNKKNHTNDPNRDRIRANDIQKDISRTLVNEKSCEISLENEKALKELLTKYCLLDEKVGYVQGMNFLAGQIIQNLNDNQSFALLRTLMFEYDLRTSFFTHLPRLKLNLYCFDNLMKAVAPHIASRFKRLNIKSCMYASEWFLTLYTYNFPRHFSERVWDLFFIEGWPILHAIGISLLLRNSEYLLENNFERSLRFLKHIPVKDESVGRIINQAYLLQISEGDLDILHRKFIDERVFLRL